MSVRKVLMVCVVALVAMLPLAGCAGKKEPAKGTPAASGAPAADAPAADAGKTSNTTDGE